VSIVRGAYRQLLRAYPREFRERFGGGMEQVFRDRYETAARWSPHSF